jgi:CHAT domain-containing protein
VVLSACRTALGKEVRGEGLLGLSRSFFAAGAARVMVSYWGVDDRATAELMTRFYRLLLVDRLRPAAALRGAQLSMLADPAWRAPYHWAGFALQGDWR